MMIVVFRIMEVVINCYWFHLLRKLLLYLFQLLHLDNRNGHNLQNNFYSVDFKSACSFREVILWGMFLYVENFYMVFGYRVVVIFGRQVRKIINDGFLRYFHYYLGKFSKYVFVCSNLYIVFDYRVMTIPLK